MQWNYFYDDLVPEGEVASLPEYLWVLRHTRRLKENLMPTPGKYKTLYDMDFVRGVFSHGYLTCVNGELH